MSAVQLGSAQVLQIAEQLGLQALEAGLPVMVTVAVMTNPGASDQQIEDIVAGNIKHTMRGKIGFAVDFVWPFVAPYVVQAIATTLTTVRASSPAQAAPNPNSQGGS